MLKELGLSERELLKLQLELFCRISELDGSMRSLRGEYTGCHKYLGSSDIYNTPLCGRQFMMLLILSQHHLALELLNHEINIYGEFDPEPLREAQILKGMKIFDMGCGYVPTLARCARRFGAEVYTSDLIPASKFNYEPNYFSPEDVALEVKNHICGDLREQKTLDEIVRVSGGDFDLVTEAHLTSGGIIFEDRELKDVKGFHGGRKIAMKLLRKSGYYYYQPSDSSSPLEKKGEVQPCL